MVQPIISPWYAQKWEYPHVVRGPNYTRPVFLEHSRQGNFVRSPIVRMPNLSGFGADPQVSLTTASPATPAALPTPEQACAPVSGTSAYSSCLKFNTDMLAAMKSDPAKAAQYTSLLTQAQNRCPDQSNFDKWAQCFYGYLEPAWYQNPLYLGGAILGAAVVLGLATRAMRKKS